MEVSSEMDIGRARFIRLVLQVGPGAPVASLLWDFSLLDMRGNTVSLSALRGKVIVLSFWASW